MQIKYRVEVWRRYLSYQWECGPLFDTYEEAERAIRQWKVVKQYPKSFRISKEYVYYGS